MAIVFEEQELYGFGFNETYGVYMLNSNHCSYTLEKGMQYLVTWDGIVYECVAQDMSAMQEGALALGNMTSFGGTGNDEPFIIGWSEHGETYMSFKDAIAHTLAIEKIEETEETAGADIVLYDRTGVAVKYENVETITTDTPDAEQGATFTYGVAVENAEYEPDFSNGNQKITLEKGQLLKEFAMVKPENLLPEYIKKNISVAGVVGEFAGDEMEKTVSLNMADGDQVIEADENTVLTKVTVMKPETFVPENIANGVDIGGVVGTYKDEFALYTNGGNNRQWNSLENIMSYAFYLNKTFENESFPRVSQVGAQAFRGASLMGIDLPTCKDIGMAAFSNCINLKSVSLPQCLSIGTYAFASCSGLTEIDLPECISVGGCAFWGCSNLAKIELPKCKSVGYYTFGGCLSIEKITLPQCMGVDNYAFSNCKNLAEIDLPECTIIRDYAFQNCSALKEMVLPQCLSIGTYAFASCGNMEVLEAIGCKSIEYAAFSKCAKLSSITLGAATITSSTFSGVASGKHLTISGTPIISGSAFYNGVMSGVSLINYSTIYASAFALCKSLKQAYVGVQAIWTGQFDRCSVLKRCIAPKNTRIGTRAFAQCSMLEFFSGYAVSYISANAFYGCNKLSVVLFTSYRSLTAALGTAFSATPIMDSSYLGYYGSIYVPESLMESYIGDSYWTAYSERFATITNEIQELCEWEEL